MSDRDKAPFWIARLLYGFAALPLVALFTLLQTGPPSAVDLWVVAFIGLVCWSASLFLARYYRVWPFNR